MGCALQVERYALLLSLPKFILPSSESCLFIYATSVKLRQKIQLPKKGKDHSSAIFHLMCVVRANFQQIDRSMARRTQFSLCRHRFTFGVAVNKTGPADSSWVPIGQPFRLGCWPEMIRLDLTPLH
jgi:hypothetical protein